MNAPAGSRTRAVVRFPLQTGHAALRSLVGATLAAMVTVVSLYSVVWLGAAIVFFVLTAGALSVAARRRATDLELSSEGLRIVGGPRNGASVPWSEVDTKRTEVLADTAHWAAPPSDGGPAPPPTEPTYKLILGVKPVEAWLVAETRVALERQQLDDVVLAIRTQADLAAGPRDAASPSPQVIVLGCPSCGACLPLEDVATSRCDRCGHDVAVPADLRRRMRQATRVASLQAEIERCVRRLLVPPRPSTVLALGLGAVGLQAAAVSLALPGHLAVGLVVGALAGASAAAAEMAADRRRLTRYVLSALPAARSADGGDLCRQCGAPLPGDENHLLHRCRYCGTESLSGIDFAGRVAATSSDRLALSEELDASKLRSSGGPLLIALLVAVHAAMVWGAAAAGRVLQP